jgi:hypothetical protein
MKYRTDNYLRALRVLCVAVLLLVSAATNSLSQVMDPGTPGPLAVTREEYNFGDTAFQPSNFPGPVELRASIHYPTNLSGTPLPVIQAVRVRMWT